ncbi:amidohydrolase family protein [Propionispora hippei]|uniref:Imidazolonepropionase n=1 Tax=Propionispora hippei DSM 15287 TaxID=1123003 RepID=A0A1M6DRX6_9FIRM|nr:amidohydrolase family protein [Propionispora hippei]SHI75994.1 Imidazolonepropionase [Propionispora hippei DSM 15287]
MPATAITNVRIFDGEKRKEPQTIVIENGVISHKTTGDTMIDGSGCTLLPGLIDSHVHLYGKVGHLEQAAAKGITTMLDMGVRDPAQIDRLRNRPGLPTILSAYNIGCAPESIAPKRMGYLNSAIIKDSEDAERFIKEQIAHGADYLKMILEEPGRNNGVAFPAEIGKAFVVAAHRNNKVVVAHAVTPGSFQDGVTFGVDVLTHMPFQAPLLRKTIEEMAARKIVCVPTLVMMQGILESMKQANPHIPFDIKTAQQSVAELHKAGVPIFAGTDSNIDDPLTLASVPYGAGLHAELYLLAEAGLTPTEVLRSATSAPATYFGLSDRGVIEVGKRADLLLVAGDPTMDITAISNIKGVWINGVEVSLWNLESSQ